MHFPIRLLLLLVSLSLASPALALKPKGNFMFPAAQTRQIAGSLLNFDPSAEDLLSPEYRRIEYTVHSDRISSPGPCKGVTVTDRSDRLIIKNKKDGEFQADIIRTECNGSEIVRSTNGWYNSNYVILVHKGISHSSKFGVKKGQPYSILRLFQIENDGTQLRYVARYERLKNGKIFPRQSESNIETALSVGKNFTSHYQSEPNQRIASTERNLFAARRKPYRPDGVETFLRGFTSALNSSAAAMARDNAAARSRQAAANASRWGEAARPAGRTSTASSGVVSSNRTSSSDRPGNSSMGVTSSSAASESAQQGETFYLLTQTYCTATVALNASGTKNEYHSFVEYPTIHTKQGRVPNSQAWVREMRVIAERQLRAEISRKLTQTPESITCANSGNGLAFDAALVNRNKASMVAKLQNWGMQRSNDFVQVVNIRY